MVPADTVARALGVSREAVELCRGGDVIDLHLDTFIWTRIFGYDPRARHGRGPLHARFFSQADLPRLIEAGVTSAIWSITTNPLRGAKGRARAFSRNLARLRALLGEDERCRVVRDLAEYRAARAEGKHAAFIGIQGGNALDEDGALSRLVDDVVVRVTLVHLSRSSLGDTSSPMRLGPPRGLTDRGREYVRELNRRRVFVDLAHIGEQSFWDAVAAHDRSQPLIVTHTGVSAVTPHWRNLSDAQLRAVADTGGVIGVVYHGPYVGGGAWSGGRCDLIAAHLQHIVQTVGAEHAALGSDWDGAIVTPRDMPTCLELPRLTQALLDRKLSPATIEQLLGKSFLRALSQLRPRVVGPQGALALAE